MSPVLSPSLSSSSSRLFLWLHELDRLAGIRRVHIREHDGAQLLEVHWFGDIAVEPSIRTLCINVPEDVSRQSNDWEIRVFVRLLPLADLAASLVAVFVWHVEIALLASHVSHGGKAYRDKPDLQLSLIHI